MVVILIKKINNRRREKINEKITEFELDLKISCENDKSSFKFKCFSFFLNKEYQTMAFKNNDSDNIEHVKILLFKYS